MASLFRLGRKRIVRWQAHEITLTLTLASNCCSLPSLHYAVRESITSWVACVGGANQDTVYCYAGSSWSRSDGCTGPSGVQWHLRRADKASNSKAAQRVTKWCERTIAAWQWGEPNGQSLAVVCFLNRAVTRFTPQTILASSCCLADRPAPRRKPRPEEGNLYYGFALREKSLLLHCRYRL